MADGCAMLAGSREPNGKVGEGGEFGECGATYIGREGARAQARDAKRRRASKAPAGPGRVAPRPARRKLASKRNASSCRGFGSEAKNGRDSKLKRMLVLKQFSWCAA